MEKESNNVLLTQIAPCFKNQKAAQWFIQILTVSPIEPSIYYFAGAAAEKINWLYDEIDSLQKKISEKEGA